MISIEVRFRSNARELNGLLFLRDHDIESMLYFDKTSTNGAWAGMQLRVQDAFHGRIAMKHAVKPMGHPHRRQADNQNGSAILPSEAAHDELVGEIHIDCQPTEPQRRLLFQACFADRRRWRYLQAGDSVNQWFNPEEIEAFTGGSSHYRLEPLLHKPAVKPRPTHNR